MCQLLGNAQVYAIRNRFAIVGRIRFQLPPHISHRQRGTRTFFLIGNAIVKQQCIRRITFQIRKQRLHVRSHCQMLFDRIRRTTNQQIFFREKMSRFRARFVVSFERPITDEMNTASHGDLVRKRVGKADGAISNSRFFLMKQAIISGCFVRIRRI